MNQRTVGAVYEKRAGAYLKQQGYELLEYNFCCRSGEIDLIAKDGAYLVFVEVKYRRTPDGGGAYLKQQGYELLEYNFCCRSGEIDLIAKDGAYLVFVEVKYRRTPDGGNPLEAVDIRKQKKISRTAAYYCMTHGYGDDTPCRFDVVAVLGENICVVKNAFECMGG